LTELLDNQQLLSETPAYVLREKCLEPLQYALESRAKKLATYAIGGIQVCIIYFFPVHPLIYDHSDQIY